MHLTHDACLFSVLLERPLDSPMTCQVTCNMSELILGHHGTIHFPAGQEVSSGREALDVVHSKIEAVISLNNTE